MIIENGIVDKAIKYLETHTPSQPISKANLAELDIWKEFLARPSLPYVLRLLCGLCKGDKKIQVKIFNVYGITIIINDLVDVEFSLS